MRKNDPVRWNLERASREFGLNPRTTRKKITAAGVIAGEDAMFSTAQIVSAIFSDKDAEDLREVRERADKLALWNSEKRRLLIETSVVEWAWADIISPAKTKLAGLPSKLQSRLGLTEAQTRELERQIDEVLQDISKEPDYTPKGATAKADEDEEA